MKTRHAGLFAAVLLAPLVLWSATELRHLNLRLGIQAVAAPLPSIAPPVEPPLDIHRIAGLFAAQLPGQNTRQQTIPLVLLASLKADHTAHSRALIQGAGTTRFYHTGETLPGGATLKTIASTQVLIVRNGREEALQLRPTPPAVLNPVTSPPSRTSP